VRKISMQHEASRGFPATADLNFLCYFVSVSAAHSRQKREETKNHRRTGYCKYEYCYERLRWILFIRWWETICEWYHTCCLDFCRAYYDWRWFFIFEGRGQEII